MLFLQEAQVIIIYTVNLMKNIITVSCLASMLFMISCQTQTTAKEDIFISKENQVILTQEEYFETHYELWIPTQEQITGALAVIITFLEDAELNNSLDEYFKSEIEKIIDNCDKYRVQFVGIIENEKNISTAISYLIIMISQIGKSS